MSNDSKTTEAAVEAAAQALWQVQPLTRENVRAAARRALEAAGPRTITTTEELDAAIVRAFEQGENLVLLDGWRPWIIWENDQGDIRVSSLPVEDDPASLSLSDISLPATVLHEPEAEPTNIDFALAAADATGVPLTEAQAREYIARGTEPEAEAAR